MEMLNECQIMRNTSATPQSTAMSTQFTMASLSQCCSQSNDLYSAKKLSDYFKFKLVVIKSPSASDDP